MLIYFNYRVDKKEEVLGIQRNLTKLYGQNFSGILSNTSKDILITGEAVIAENFHLHLYSIMTAVATVTALFKTYILLSYCRRASVNIHKAVLGSLMTAPMAFFDTNFIGNILNRCSQDMNNVDELLPFVFTEVFRVSFVAH